jgi:phospholipid/cholesterol/gamma-HCH transport system permease protein
MAARTIESEVHKRLTLTGFFETIGDFGYFTARIFRNIFKRPLETSETGRQIVEIGSRSVGLIACCGFALGIVMSLHTRASMERFGASSMIPAVMTIAFFREMGPLITGLLISGRVGAGIGAELAGMRVTEQIDALESLGIDSFRYLVVTRVIACIIALPVLTLLMDFSGLLGGLLSEVTVSHISWRLYVYRAFGSMDWSDYIPTTLKTAVFGLLIGAVSCFLGYNAKDGAFGAGRASTRSVVYSSLVIILIDIVLVKMTSFFFPQGGA